MLGKSGDEVRVFSYRALPGETVSVDDGPVALGYGRLCNGKGVQAMLFVMGYPENPGPCW